jgi:hypothetical protein
MKHFILAIAVTLVLCACAGQPQRFEKAGITDAQAKWDLSDCTYQAQLMTVMVRNEIEQTLENIRLKRECLALKGYTKVNK